MTDKDEALFVDKIALARLGTIRNLLAFQEALYPDAVEILRAELKERAKRQKKKGHVQPGF
jgi:hypothetical protein